MRRHIHPESIVLTALECAVHFGDQCLHFVIADTIANHNGYRHAIGLSGRTHYLSIRHDNRESEVGQ